MLLCSELNLVPTVGTYKLGHEKTLSLPAFVYLKTKGGKNPTVKFGVLY